MNRGNEKHGRLQAVLRLALLASCAGAFELSHTSPRMRLQRRAAIAANARPLIMGQPDEIHDTADEPPLPEECGPYLTIKGKSINAFGALYGVQSVLLLGPLWCSSRLESAQPRPLRPQRRADPARARAKGSGPPPVLGSPRPAGQVGWHRPAMSIRCHDNSTSGGGSGWGWGAKAPKWTSVARGVVRSSPGCGRLGQS